MSLVTACTKVLCMVFFALFQYWAPIQASKHEIYKSSRSIPPEAWDSMGLCQWAQGGSKDSASTCIIGAASCARSFTGTAWLDFTIILMQTPDESLKVTLDSTSSIFGPTFAPLHLISLADWHTHMHCAIACLWLTSNKAPVHLLYILGIPQCIAMAATYNVLAIFLSSAIQSHSQKRTLGRSVDQ